MSELRICSRCVSDTTIPSIRFDENGVCQFCKSHDRLAAQYQDRHHVEKQLELLVQQIKAEGKSKRYDCIVGVSGGTDSSYTLHLVTSLGLRPLAVHFDNSWNTDQSVTNIKNLITALDVDLHTHVVDWEEFKDLQIAFLKASVPCIEAPTDVAIHAVLYQMAVEEGVRFILGGQSFMTEGTVPREWSYLDGTYIRSVHRRFGRARLRTYPNLSLKKIFHYTFVKRIRQIPFLNYFDYRKEDAKKFLSEKYGWADYGGHHYENIYSKFAFGWYLPVKFGIDKRKVSLSGPVRSGHLKREVALEMLKEKPRVDLELVDYVIQKLGLSKENFEDLLKQPNKCYRDYFTSESILKRFKFMVKMAVRMNLLPAVLYEKYFE